MTAAANIAGALGSARREGRGWRCRCPVHGGHSLVIADGDGGRLLVRCWAGCTANQVFAELRRSGHLSDDRAIPRSPDQIIKHRTAVEADRRRRTAVALNIWNESYAAKETIVERYWRSRGITLPIPSTVAMHGLLAHRESGGQRPAQVALVQHVYYGPVGIHLTYLAIDGSIKAAVDPVKRSLGPIGGGAVRLAPTKSCEELVVGEGIETVLSVMQATGLPGWAALSANGIRSLVLPAEVRRILIAADNDANGVGQAAAYDAASRWLDEGRQVRIALPPEVGTAFNDILRQQRSASRAESINHG